MKYHTYTVPEPVYEPQHDKIKKKKKKKKEKKRHFAVHIKKASILSYALSARKGSD